MSRLDLIILGAALIAVAATSGVWVPWPWNLPAALAVGTIGGYLLTTATRKGKP